MPYHFDTGADKEVVLTEEESKGGKAPSQTIKHVTWFPFLINSDTEALKYAQTFDHKAVRLVKKEKVWEFQMILDTGKRRKISLLLPYLTNSQDIPCGSVLYA